MTASAPRRACRTACTMRGTILAEASPPFASVAVHAGIRWSSSTWVAPSTAGGVPRTVPRYGRYASAVFLPIPTVGKRLRLLAASESRNPASMKSMPWLFAMDTTSTPAVLSAAKAELGARKRNSLPGAGLPSVVMAVSRLTMEKSAARSVLAIGPSAVRGLASRARSEPSKCTSPPKARMIGCFAAGDVGAGGFDVAPEGGVSPTAAELPSPLLHAAASSMTPASADPKAMFLRTRHTPPLWKRSGRPGWHVPAREWAEQRPYGPNPPPPRHRDKRGRTLTTRRRERCAPRPRRRFPLPDSCGFSNSYAEKAGRRRIGGRPRAARRTSRLID